MLVKSLVLIYFIGSTLGMQYYVAAFQRILYVYNALVGRAFPKKFWVKKFYLKLAVDHDVEVFHDFPIQDFFPFVSAI